MKLRLTSAIALGAILCALAFAKRNPGDPPGIIGQWSSHAADLAARGFENASLFLNTTTILRRDRLASIEMMSEYPIEHPLRRRGASIGMLLIEMEAPDGSRSSFSCTAALLRRALVITNQHCLKKGGSIAVELMLWLDHTDKDDGTFLTLDPKPLETDAALDFALLHLREARAPTALSDLDGIAVRAAIPGERLFIIHHAKGKAQQISRAFCRAFIEQLRSNEISHSCPTHPGSSGALVFAESDGAIVGLHHSATTKPDTVRGYATTLTVIVAKSQVLAPRTAAR